MQVSSQMYQQMLEKNDQKLVVARIEQAFLQFQSLVKDKDKLEEI